MTFIENNAAIHTLSKEYQSENLEKNNFKKIIITISTILFLIVLYFVISAFYINTKNENRSKTVSEKSSKNETLLLSSNTNIEKNETFNHLIPINILNPKEELLKEIKDKNIFHISSSNPEGFYIMVGSFGLYQNALKLQEMNMSEYVCYIFEPNYEEINRVGLFISETDLRKTENALTEIKNLQPESWVLYNSMN